MTFSITFADRVYMLVGAAVLGALAGWFLYVETSVYLFRRGELATLVP